MPSGFASLGINNVGKALNQLPSFLASTGPAQQANLGGFTDRLGPIAIAVYPALAVPLLVLMGLADVAKPGFATFALLSMTMISGTHFGMHSIAGLFYPSAIRANGAGWATSVAKIGSVFAPLLGGYLLASNLPPRYLFVLLAVTPLLAAISLLLLLGRHFAARREAPPAHRSGNLVTRPSSIPKEIVSWP